MNAWLTYNKQISMKECPKCIAQNKSRFMALTNMWRNLLKYAQWAISWSFRIRMLDINLFKWTKTFIGHLIKINVLRICNVDVAHWALEMPFVIKLTTFVQKKCKWIFLEILTIISEICRLAWLPMREPLTNHKYK